MLVRLARLVYAPNTGGQYERAPWGDEAVNLNFVRRAVEVQVHLKDVGLAYTLMLYMVEDSDPKRYLGTLAGLLEAQGRVG